MPDLYRPYQARRYQTYQPSIRQSPVTPKPRSHRRFFMAASLIVCLVIGANAAFAKQHTPTHHSRLKAASVTTPLQSKIAAIISAHPDLRIGVAVRDITTHDTVTYGSTTPFTGASTTKLLVATAYLHYVEQGELSLSTQLGDYPASFQLQQMIQQSNNDSWNLLTNELGLDRLQQYATSIGVTYNTSDNSITPASMADFLDKLQSGLLLSSDDISLLKSYMQHTNDESLLSSVIPAGVTIYHKYGELDNDLHDVAIVSDGNDTYAVAIYTETNAPNSADETTRENVVKNIGQAIFSKIFG